MPLVRPMVAAFGLVFRITEGLMRESSTSAGPSQSERPTATADRALTISAISVIAAILTNVLHEGVGHGLTALLTGAKSGVFTTVAWSSAFDSHLVEAGGTLVNLAAALLFWLLLRSTKNAAMPLRYFMLICSSPLRSTCLRGLDTFSFQV